MHRVAGGRRRRGQKITAGQVFGHARLSFQTSNLLRNQMRNCFGTPTGGAPLSTAS